MAMKIFYENLIAKPNIAGMMLKNINVHPTKFLGGPTFVIKQS